MKQRNFNTFRSPEAERFSGRQFHDAVQTLDNARRNGAVSPEQLEDQNPLTPQALGHLLDRLQRAPHAAGASRVKQSPGPGHPFDDHPVGRALHPPHRVDEEHRTVPEPHKLEPSTRKPVVPGAVTAGDKIEALRQWASGRCLWADRAGCIRGQRVVVVGGSGGWCGSRGRIERLGVAGLRHDTTRYHFMSTIGCFTARAMSRPASLAVPRK